jgi:hypothetical protein
MASIFSSDLHRNENASITFGGAILGVVWDVRSDIANLAKSRKADEYAPGAIHALRKLCEGEDSDCGQIYRLEVEEWHATFLAWFERVKRFFPAQHAKKFLANAEDDFRVILESSVKMPESYWRDDVDKRRIKITFKNEEALDAAQLAAEEKHPVDLGNALHEYIGACIRRLVGETPQSSGIAKTVAGPSPAAFAPRVTATDGGWNLYLDDFDCFDKPADVEQDIVVTAYDVEDAVKNYMSANHATAAKAVDYDCESSLFCARVSKPDALSTLLQTLLQLATDQELFARFQIAPKKKKKGKAKPQS